MARARAAVRSVDCPQVVEQRRVAQAALLAEPDEHEIAGEVAPDLDE